MKLRPNDKRYPILITGRELEELQRFTWHMAEAFGLDRRIDNYRGTRPIGLYRWDMECLIDVIEMALVDPKEYPRQTGPGYEAMKTLCERLKQLKDQAYAELGLRR